MSTIGTGVAAGVAQVAQAAREASRARDKRHADRADQSRDTLERAEALLRAGQTSDPDAELPDRQAPGYEGQLRPGGARRGEATQDGPDPSRPADDEGEPKHIDLQA